MAGIEPAILRVGPALADEVSKPCAVPERRSRDVRRGRGSRLAGVEPASWRSWSLRGAANVGGRRAYRAVAKSAPGRRRAARRGARGARRPGLSAGDGESCSAREPRTRVGARVRIEPEPSRLQGGARPFELRGRPRRLAGASRRQHRHPARRPQGARLFSFSLSRRRPVVSLSRSGRSAPPQLVQSSLSSQGGELLFVEPACDRQSRASGIEPILLSTKRVLVQSSYAGKCLRCSASSSRREARAGAGR